MPCASGSLTSGNTQDSTLTTPCCPRGNSPGLSTRDTLTDGVFSSVYLVVDINCLQFWNNSAAYLLPQNHFVHGFSPFVLPRPLLNCPLSCRDDPRFPTVRGVLRRGMTVEGLKQFIAAQVQVSFLQRDPDFNLVFCPTCRELRATDVTDD